jgi:hypothetical protein
MRSSTLTGRPAPATPESAQARAAAGPLPAVTRAALSHPALGPPSRATLRLRAIAVCDEHLEAGDGVDRVQGAAAVSAVGEEGVDLAELGDPAEVDPAELTAVRGDDDT